jgi:predicted nucleotidyltransferase
MVAPIDFKDFPVNLSREVVEEFCRRWKIARLELFGSVLREDFGPDSDLDFLYTFAADACWGWEIVTIADDLSQIVGRPVDLVSRRAVERSNNRSRREAILNSAKVLYAA